MGRTMRLRIFQLALGAALSSVVGLCTLFDETAHARSCRVTLIPNGSKFSCSSCHVSSGGGGARNPFGEAVRALITPSAFCSGESFWGAPLAAADSDGDGRTNGEELGDPDGSWKPGSPAPGQLALVTNPGVDSFIRGDFNSDGKVDLADAVATLELLYRKAAAPTCRAAANANDDTAGVIDISDAVSILIHLFGENRNPRPPFPACGNTADDNDCATYTGCS